MWSQKWVLGNWKMNGRTARNQDLLEGILPQAACGVQVGVAVPAVYLAAVAATAGQALWAGAQDVSRFEADGAFTGETSAAMLADAGARFVLVGHSERRQYFGEDNTVLAEKLHHSLAAGLVPVLCVGETLAERDVGEAEAVVARQLAVLKDWRAEGVAVAYEPVWAIGTGRVAEAAQIAAMHAFIYRQILSLCGEGAKIRVLYGGSVNAANAADILAIPQVDGALVGGASLQAEPFTAIIQAARTAAGALS
ncbi:triosephosphate isomerase [Neisseria sp. HSC-16F19]|nr:triose-phosphate isomerase [Neisseria sp. HSC-16F19]MCP2041011.1 triosephosphate isomerase [Neisseria sp. HSC-16F19]